MITWVANKRASVGFATSNKTWNTLSHGFKAEHNDKGTNPRFVVTNIPIRGVIDETWHRPRVNGKQVQLLTLGRTLPDPRSRRVLQNDVLSARIRWKTGSQQNFLFADRTSCTKFMATISITVFICVRVGGLRRLRLAGTEQARWRVRYDSFAVVQNRSTSTSDFSPRRFSLSQQLSI